MDLLFTSDELDLNIGLLQNHVFLVYGDQYMCKQVVASDHGSLSPVTSNKILLMALERGKSNMAEKVRQTFHTHIRYKPPSYS